LTPNDDIFQDRELRKRKYILVNHPEARPDGVPRASKRDRFPVQIYGTRIRPDTSKEDVHEGCLTCAVFPCDGVNLPLPDREGNILVCVKIAEFFRDMPDIDQEEGLPSRLKFGRLKHLDLASAR